MLAYGQVPESAVIYIFTDSSSILRMTPKLCAKPQNGRLAVETGPTRMGL
ncbi:hypothetical protein J21TS7_44300 [Paenibacillus cineris]|uniref:Uncharacterized protein n=1 Tax=Paenibacillus cineris TaxID=237530 RepID=A0ABQ4LHY9_9BACL|nr:hypothetical protein J21TS7_44300 [Paenibacillus cineris]GIO61782.1 hypothetical protein J43TS9_33560 [Paenibacillus cineris]